MTHGNPTDGAPSRRGETSLTVDEVARLTGGRLDGDPSVRVRGIAALDDAEEDEMGFLADRRYLDALSRSRAAAVLVSSKLHDAALDARTGTTALVVVDDPHGALPDLLQRFHPAPELPPGIHPTAVLGSGVDLGEDVRVGPYAVVGEDVRVGPRTRIDAHVVVGSDSQIGAECVLHPHVVLYRGSTLGDRVVLHAGVKIGVDGFGYATENGSHRKIPQVGGCVIEDDVEIGANATVDRGSIGRTLVGRGVKMDNLVHLGHNVTVGEGSMIVAQTGVAGSTRIGKGVLCGGQAGLSGHIEVGDGARIAAQAGVIGDVEEGATVTGFPARDHRDYLRGMALVMKLPDLNRRLRAVEEELKKLEDG